MNSFQVPSSPKSPGVSPLSLTAKPALVQDTTHLPGPAPVPPPGSPTGGGRTIGSGGSGTPPPPPKPGG